jgi:hypothetical protein
VSDHALEFSSIEEIIADVAAGKLVIVADDPSRENEADLIGAASLCTSEMVNFMAVHARGLICAPVIADRAEHLVAQCPDAAIGGGGGVTAGRAGHRGIGERAAVEFQDDVADSPLLAASVELGVLIPVTTGRAEPRPAGIRTAGLIHQRPKLINVHLACSSNKETC